MKVESKSAAGMRSFARRPPSNGDGKPAREFPLKDNYFEVTVPRAFFEGNPKTITVGWIDFYR